MVIFEFKGIIKSFNPFERGPVVVLSHKITFITEKGAHKTRAKEEIDQEQ